MHCVGTIFRSALVRATLVAVLLAAGLTACSSSAPVVGQAGSEQHPNIVFVLTDDLSTDLVPFMPHVVALMHQGTSFSHYYVVDSLCCPSRSAIFTGEYPHDDGVFTNNHIDGGFDAFERNGDEHRTFATTLQHAGYDTAMMGKYLNGYQPTTAPQQGWNEWDVAGDGYPEYDYALNHDGTRRFYGRRPHDYLTNVLSRRADSFIDSASSRHRPFALEVATFAPHRPATPAPRYRNSFETVRVPHGPSWDRRPTAPPSWLAHFPPLTRRNQAFMDKVYRLRVESVQSVDLLIARLEARLRADHELGRTYFVFSSDNGFHEGQYRLFPGKQTAFDTDTRVPLIVAGPGVPAGRTVSALGSSIDLAPTFDAMAHTAPNARVDGVSMLALMKGRPVPADWQRAVLIEHHGPDFDHQDPDYQPVRAGDPPTYEAIRTPNALYVEYVDGEREYYDTRTDPNELHNLAASAPASVLGPLHRTLEALERCHRAHRCRSAASPAS